MARKPRSAGAHERVGNGGVRGAAGAMAGSYNGASRIRLDREVMQHEGCASPGQLGKRLNRRPLSRWSGCATCDNIGGLPDVSRADFLSRGVAKLVKAPDFDSGMRGFESFLPCHCYDG